MKEVLHVFVCLFWSATISISAIYALGLFGIT